MLAPVKFPAAWTWLMDEGVPSFVKKHYSPKENWQDKPFSNDDVRFFSKGVFELSDLFTEGRGAQLHSYFNHPKSRSAYLLYFLPLQAAKFIALFQLHPEALQAALDHAGRTGTLRVTDLGAGPGTASLALLLQLLSLPADEIPAKIILTWFDTNATIMKEGRELALTLAAQFPKLRGRVEVECVAEPWWKARAELDRRKSGEQSLLFVGHLLNENAGRKDERLRLWRELLEIASGGGTLIVEPASRSTSQGLSELRDYLIQQELVTEGHIWGPCLHAGRCPLAAGRDWCHFSMPVSIPGQWFRELSRKLSTEKNWVKFSYLWLAAEGTGPEPAAEGVRRVVSDRLRAKNGVDTEILLCEPEYVGRAVVPYSRELFRGDLYDPSQPAKGARVKPAPKPGFKPKRPR